MQDRKPRYVTSRPGAAGEPPRWYWQPSTELIAQGWRARRIPARWSAYADPEALRAAAWAEATILNQEMDAARDAAALAAVDVGKPKPPAPRTVAALIKDYRSGKAYKALRPKTRHDYDYALDRIAAWAGPEPVRAIDGARVETFRAGMAATPAMANSVTRVLRLLLNHAVARTWIAINPAARPELETAPPSAIIWPAEAVDRMVAAADALGYHAMGTAIRLNAWIGQREGDVIRVPRTIYRDGALAFRQSKTDAAVSLPVDLVPALKQRLAEEFARQDARRKPGAAINLAAPIILSEETGRPYKGDYFRHIFAKVRAQAEATMLIEAGWTLEPGGWSHPEIAAAVKRLSPKHRAAAIEAARLEAASFPLDHARPGFADGDPAAYRLPIAALRFMHLRHTAITRMAEAGCTLADIASVSGHTLKSVHGILERYMVRTRALSEGAFRKRLEKENG